MPADRAIKEPCRVATTGAISLTGLSTIDGVPLAAGDRVLVKAQASAVNNGIWEAASSAWTRASDFDGAGDVVGGTQVGVTSGAVNAGSAWQVAGEGAIAIGSDPIAFDIAYDSDSVSFTQAAGVVRTVQSKLRDVVSVKDFGAIGDGFEHPLSEFFTTLPEAQSVYPAATACTNLVDGLAIQKAIDAVENVIGIIGRGRVYIPAGRYRGNTGSIRLPDFVELVGDGPGISIIDNQNTVVNYPLVVNKNPAGFFYSAIRHLSLHGGTHGLKICVTSEVAGLTCDHVSFALQSDKNLECNKLLQLSEFNQCVFAASPLGVYVAEATTNAVNFYNCSFENHSNTHLYLRSAEGVNFYGGRFEAGGAAGSQATIDLDSARSVNFYGVYFERTHEILLRETNSDNSVVFNGCHFTGAHIGSGFIPYRFESDGEVEFGTNSWFQSSDGAERMRITGDNGGKLGSNDSFLSYARGREHQVLISRTVPVPPGLAKDLVVINRAGAFGSPSNMQALTGMLTINYMGLEAGGFGKRFSKILHVSLIAAGFATMVCDLAEISNQDDAPGSTMTVRVKAGASFTELLIEAVFTGLNPATAIVGGLQYSFDYIAQSMTYEDYLNVRLV